MDLERTSGLGTALYAGALGLIYVVLGLAEMANGFELVEITYIPTDIFGGIMCILIGIVFLRGLGPLSSGRANGLSFLIVGVMVTAIYSGLYLAIMGSHGLGLLIGMEDFEGWLTIDDLRPEIWLPLLALPAVAMLRSKLKRKTPNSSLA
jgi:hypothetical protein